MALMINVEESEPKNWAMNKNSDSRYEYSENNRLLVVRRQGTA